MKTREDEPNNLIPSAGSLDIAIAKTEPCFRSGSASGSRIVKRGMKEDVRVGDDSSTAKKNPKA